MIRGDDNDPKITALNHQNWATVAPLVRPNTIYENDDSTPFCVAEEPTTSCATTQYNPNGNMVLEYQSCPVPGSMRHYCDTGKGRPPFDSSVLGCLSYKRAEFAVKSFDPKLKS